MLVVDDSAYVRKVVTQMLSRSPFIEVVGDGARRPRRRSNWPTRLQPDVITCDLNMPEMDGVAFVQAQMATPAGADRHHQRRQRRRASRCSRRSTPAPSTSCRSRRRSPAIGCSTWPTSWSQKVKAAAGRQCVARRPSPPEPLRGAAAPRSGRAGDGAVDIVVIGISTGGPQALKVAHAAPAAADFPVPVGIVLHMPVGYTELYAREARRAVADDREGSGGRRRTAAGARVCWRPPDATSRSGGPATASSRISTCGRSTRRTARRWTCMFQSAAEIYGARTLGVVMTGMGADGREGAAWIKARGRPNPYRSRRVRASCMVCRARSSKRG